VLPTGAGAQPWLSAARALGKASDEAIYHEFNDLTYVVRYRTNAHFRRCRRIPTGVPAFSLDQLWRRPVPAFFFHIQAGDDFIRDEEGVELPDRAAAEADALEGARSLMSADVQEGRLRLDWCILVHDAEGRHLKTVRFAEAIVITGCEPGNAPERS
jgi:hypothetical protein